MTLADLQTLAISLLGLGIAGALIRDWRDRGTAAEQMMNSPYPGNACRTRSGDLPQLARGDESKSRLPRAFQFISARSRAGGRAADLSHGRSAAARSRLMALGAKADEHAICNFADALPVGAGVADPRQGHNVRLVNRSRHVHEHDRRAFQYAGKSEQGSGNVAR